MAMRGMIDSGNVTPDRVSRFQTTEIVFRNTFLTVMALILAAASAAALPSARFKAIEFRDGAVLVKLAAPTTWRTTPWRSANRYIVDISATGADPKQRKLDVDSARLRGVRWTQFK